jgi:hypothetical protein
MLLQEKEGKKMQVILPKTYVGYSRIVKPIFYLMGPIKGGGDWQLQACLNLQSLLDDFTVVIPCRYSQDHPLYARKMTGREYSNDRQTYWERGWLDQIATSGAIIAWLPRESKTQPRTDGSPYARDTYGELGEWRGHLMNYGEIIHFVLGAEPDFPGLDVISANFQFAIGPEFPIYPTLVDTIQAAVNQVSK